MAADHFKPQDLFTQMEALEQALASETAARVRAENESRAKSDLLATVSHEVRTPLGAIISMADLLLSTPLNETQKKYAATLQQSGRGLLTVVNGVLDFSKLDAGRFELDRASFDFPEMMRGVEEALRARARGKGIDAKIELAGSCPRHLVGDSARIRQVLDNLIDNAVKFTEKGSITLRASPEKLDRGMQIRFEVIDTGLGLTQQQIRRLFTPYTQGDSSVSSKYGGTGLGLSIAKRLAELMGGKMGCESERGLGSTFWFTIPVALADAPPKLNGGADAPPMPGGPLNGRVLVVEDNQVNQMLIAAYLDRFGLDYEMAANGALALDRLTTESYDLVLMDVMMPEMDGIECTRRIRSLSGDIARTPIIALTANAMKGDRENYLAAGMDAYVSKPVSARDLFEAIAAHIPGAARPASASAR
ncbi:MAG: ATP-binding protein [Pseudomonadota bacterium]|nr:ATP-binding protein [Pseudomonadota bacterium]